MELIGVVIAAGVAAWVYSDALARKARHPILWGLGTFLLLIVVLPAWLIMRPPTEARRSEAGRCPWCEASLPPSAKYCSECGRDVRMDG